MVADRGLSDPPIEIEEFRFIFPDDFCVASEPIIEVRLADVRPVGQQSLFAFHPGVGWTVEGCELRIIDVGFDLAAAVQEKIVLHAMRRGTQMQSLSANCFR